MDKNMETLKSPMSNAEIKQNELLGRKYQLMDIKGPEDPMVQELDQEIEKLSNTIRKETGKASQVH